MMGWGALGCPRPSSQPAGRETWPRGSVHMLERQGRAASDCSELQLGGSDQLFHPRGSWGKTEELGKT